MDTATGTPPKEEAAAPGTSTSQGNPQPPASNGGAAAPGETEPTQPQPQQKQEHSQPAVDDLITKLRKEREAQKKPEPEKVEKPEGSQQAEETEAGTTAPGTKTPGQPAQKEPQTIYNSLATGIVNALDQVFPRLIKWAKNEEDHTPYHAAESQKEYLVGAWEAWFRFLKIQFSPFVTVLIANGIVYWQFFNGLFFIRIPLLMKGFFKKKVNPADKARQQAELAAILQEKAEAEAKKQKAAAEAAEKAKAEEAAKTEAAEAAGWHKCKEDKCTAQTKGTYCKSHAAKHREAERKAKEKAEKK